MLSELRVIAEEQQLRLEESIEDARRGKLGQPPPSLLAILLLGASGAGKSELLNALAGERIAESNYLRPTTTRPTIYAHESVSPERLFEFGTLLGELAKQPEALRSHKREELRDKIVIDAPDIDSFRTEHRDLVMQLLPIVDVALYVVTAHNYKDDVGWQTMLAQRGRRAFAFVFNKWDPEGKPASPAGAPGVDDDFRSMLQARGGFSTPLIFRTSAKHWAAHRADGADAAPPTGDQFPDLEAWLSSGLSTNQVEQIKRRRTRALWAALGARIRSAAPPPLPEEALTEAVTGELNALKEDGVTLLRPPLWARARELASKRDAERQPTSPGPFGLAMKAIGGVVVASRMVSRAGARSADAVLADTSTQLPEQLGDMIARRTATLEWKMREMKVRAEWLTEQWSHLAPTVFPEVSETADVTTAELATRSTGRFRRVAAIALLAALELLTIVIVGIAGYRLALGFISGAYTDAAFIANLVGLVVCILVLGSFLMNLLAPRLENLFRRELETRVFAAWNKGVDRLRTKAEDFIARYHAVHDEGIRLGQECEERIAEISRHIGAMPGEEVAKAEQLFAADDADESAENAAAAVSQRAT